MLKIEGSKIIALGNYEVTEPAVLFDKIGVLHKFGNYADLLPIFNVWTEKDKTGEISKDLVLMIFDLEKLTLEEVVETVEKMMSISGYCKIFYEDLIKNTFKESETYL